MIRTKVVTHDSKATEEITAPIDVMNTILEYDDIASVSGHGAVPLVATLFTSIKTGRLKKLLIAIVNGEPDIVKAMLEKEPSLLLEKLDENNYVTALSGQRCNNVTAYRTALAVEDTQMALLLKNKLFELTGNDEAANTQYHEQYPEGWKIDETKRWAPVFTILDSLKDTIRDAKPYDISSSDDPEYKLTVKEGSDVAIVLALFRSHTNALLQEVVTTARHFNPHLLLKALQMYDHILKDFAWSDPRALLFWQQIIGTIQRGLPVNYVQAFRDSLYITEEKLRNNQSQGRSLKIRLIDTQHLSRVPTDFYPLSASRLGFDYAIYEEVELGLGTLGSDLLLYDFRSLCQSKTACMQQLIPRSKNVRRCLTFCSVM